MFIHVGPFPYRVRLVHGYIHHEGDPCLGLCDNTTQQILISDVPPEKQRLQVFFHELMHAWWYHFQVDTRDQEAVVDLVGIAMTDFVSQAVAKIDRAELERALSPPKALAEAQSTTRPKPAASPRHATARKPAHEPHPAADADPPPAVACAGTIEQAGWRIHLYEPAEAASVPGDDAPA